MKRSFLGKLASTIMDAFGDFKIENGELTAYKGRGPNVEIPPAATKIGPMVFTGYGDNVKTIKIPNHVTEIHPWAFVSCDGVEQFIVPYDHPVFWSVNGALLSKNGKTLLAAPRAVTQFTVPETVREFAGCVFDGCQKLEEL